MKKLCAMLAISLMFTTAITPAATTYKSQFKNAVQNAKSEAKASIKSTKTDLKNAVRADINNQKAKHTSVAAEKKAEGDALRDAVQAVLTEEYQTINDIASQVEGEEITKAKITARLTSLVKNGLAEKADVKTEDGKTVKAYKLV